MVVLVFEPVSVSCEWCSDFEEYSVVLFEVAAYEVVVAWECVSESVFEVLDCFSVVDVASDCFIEVWFGFVFEFDCYSI